MQKVLILGCPGAGKSTFARRLHAVTGLPLHYLDRLWHRPDRTTAAPEDFDRALAQILAGDRWIVDGNYLRTLERRLQACDTVFFLDYPLALCLAGVQARLGVPREDLPWVETVLDEEFRQEILDFPTVQRPQVLRLLAAAGDKHIVTFRTRGEAGCCLQRLAAQAAAGGKDPV